MAAEGMYSTDQACLMFEMKIVRQHGAARPCMECTRLKSGKVAQRPSPRRRAIILNAADMMDMGSIPCFLAESIKTIDQMVWNCRGSRVLRVLAYFGFSANMLASMTIRGARVTESANSRMG